ncbi:MAG TPA: UDP-3-O-(3-hydroxymyristoyl)glucosamine N-acyltransferase, partial [Hyphomonadaceae bacterium]|nr:UDP-3-O-(3-hydroxymyristoyl)glucosamine N-acyltransferase [Hyphomonadaceae bacterium]
IGPGVQIGSRTVIGANASVRCVLIGDGVRIFPGAVIGETGFGLAVGGSGAALTPHFGRVIMQNGVSLGANSCIDRGLLEDTVIGEGTHIDNLCHIGHNCRIGSHVVMAAFAGVSGSSKVGDGAQFGGRVGLKDHVHVGQGARIAAGAAVLTDVPAGETWAGYPSKPIRTWMRELAWLARSAQKRSSKED